MATDESKPNVSDLLTLLQEEEEEGSASDSSQNGPEKPQNYIYFTPLALKYIQRRTHASVQSRYTSIGEKFNMCFKLLKSDSKLVKTLMYSYGFMLVGAHVLRSLKSWQRINHFPRSYLITKKDTLYESIDRCSVQYGDWFDFIPEYFCTPLTETKRLKLISKCREIESGHSTTPFIVKPAGSSRGIGIRFLESSHEIDQLDHSSKLLISRYIDRPFLVNNLKFDLRVYVLVTSFYPLIVYVYSDGLARFAVHEYAENRKNYSDVNTHLTNYSLNKSSKDFVKNSRWDSENVGHKWTLGALLRDMDKKGVDTGLLMVRIEDIVVKTLLSIQGSVAASCRKLNLHPKCCFELFGFDILVDENLKPWLLEVNLSPSLACDAPLDSILKTNLLADTLNVAEMPLVRSKNVFNKCAHKDTASLESTSTNSSGSPNPSDFICDEYDISMRRRKLNSRASKIRRAQLNHKPSFSADNVTSQYLLRARCHFDKMQSESQKKGHFVRVFPRKSSWDMYASILEDVGQEKWDEDLYNRMMEGERRPDLTVRDVRLAHEQLLDAAQFPSRRELNPTVRNVILEEALNEANRYRMKMYSADIKPYPASLPRVRSPARRRTKSQLFAEELRKQNLVAQKPKDKEPNRDIEMTILAEFGPNELTKADRGDQFGPRLNGKEQPAALTEIDMNST